jgi:hypothetical protein
MSSSLVQTANKAKSYKLFGLENASPTFQKIITKYRNKRKDLQEKPKTIMAFVEKARYQAENMETEDEYMIKELRNDRKFSEQLILLYGQRAEKHYNELNNHKVSKLKLKKNYFFTPSELQKLKREKNKTRNTKSTPPYLTDLIFLRKPSIFVGDKILKMTSTFNKEKKSYNSSKNSTGMLGFYNTASNIKTVSNDKIRKNDIKKNSITKFNTENNILPEVKKQEPLLLLDLNSNTNVRDRILTLTKRRSTKYVNKTNDEFSLDRMEYMNKLVKINNDFMKTKNEFRKHFKTNDYGCTFSKLEYEFLTKKYFK